MISNIIYDEKHHPMYVYLSIYLFVHRIKEFIPPQNKKKNEIKFCFLIQIYFCQKLLHIFWLFIFTWSIIGSITIRQQYSKFQANNRSEKQVASKHIVYPIHNNGIGIEPNLHGYVRNESKT